MTMYKELLNHVVNWLVTMNILVTEANELGKRNSDDKEMYRHVVPQCNTDTGPDAGPTDFTLNISRSKEEGGQFTLVIPTSTLPVQDYNALVMFVQTNIVDRAIFLSRTPDTITEYMIAHHTKLIKLNADAFRKYFSREKAVNIFDDFNVDDFQNIVNGLVAKQEQNHTQRPPQRSIKIDAAPTNAAVAEGGVGAGGTAKKSRNR